jgi:hypothetical protein
MALYEVRHSSLQSPHLRLILRFANQILDSRFPRKSLQWYALPLSFSYPFRFRETCFEPISCPQRLPIACAASTRELVPTCSASSSSASADICRMTHVMATLLNLLWSDWKVLCEHYQEKLNTAYSSITHRCPIFLPLIRPSRSQSLIT